MSKRARDWRRYMRWYSNWALAEKMDWPYRIWLSGYDNGFSRDFDPLGNAEDSERLLEAMPDPIVFRKAGAGRAAIFAQ